MSSLQRNILYLPQTVSAEEEVFTQMQMSTTPEAAFDSAQLQVGPGHHFLLPVPRKQEEAIFVGNDLIRGRAREEIKHQNIRIYCSLIGADKL